MTLDQFKSKFKQKTIQYKKAVSFLNDNSEFKDQLLNQFNFVESEEELVYCSINDIKNRPVCSICGSCIEFRKSYRGYPRTCSKSCASKLESKTRLLDVSEDLKNDKERLKLLLRERILSKSGKINSNLCQESVLEHEGILNQVKSLYQDSKSISETIYRIANDIEERPTCKVCGSEVNFKPGVGFSRYCSKKCANNDPEVISKISESCSKSLKRAYEDNGEKIKERRSSTLKEHYGENAKSPFALQEVKDLIKKKNIEKFGASNVLALPMNRTKAVESQRSKAHEHWLSLGFNVEFLDNDECIVHDGCQIHGDYKLPTSYLRARYLRWKVTGKHICPKCNPFYNHETGIEHVIKNILEKHDVNFIMHDRKLIKPYEVDFYIPNYRLAIECNGLYWHSDKNITKTSHLEKLNRVHNAGASLLYFWEDNIMFKPEIVENIILSTLGIYERRIYARQCEIRHIQSKQAREFLDKHHLQGNINASIRYGLFFNDELVEVMTFGKPRKVVNLATSEKDSYELYRLCSKSGVQIIGGASKLFKRFIKEFNPKKVISYANKEISNGGVYKCLGFSREKDSKPGYSYFIRGEATRQNRFKFTKQRIDDGTGRTEEQIMREDYKASKCYDCGQMRFIWSWEVLDSQTLYHQSCT